MKCGLGRVELLVQMSDYQVAANSMELRTSNRPFPVPKLQKTGSVYGFKLENVRFMYHT
jgi:hypothetical protein